MNVFVFKYDEFLGKYLHFHFFPFALAFFFFTDSSIPGAYTAAAY